MWNFQKLGPHDTRQQSKLDEFFLSQTPATSLVRESIQNSLDAKVKDATGPTIVKYEFRNISGEILKKYSPAYNEHTLSDHLKSDGLGKFKVTNFEQNARCLLVADFNTTGLIGETDHHLNAEAKSPFIGFWWQEGISDKKKGSGGSHGVGKTTLSGSSGAYTFLALTKRQDDDKELLIGFSNLPYHSVNNQQYRGYGRFGNKTLVDGDEHFMPISDANKINEFKKDFNAQRNTPGLSVLIPRVLPDITPDSICKAVIGDYCMAILSNKLEVEVIDHNEDKLSVVISADNITEIASKIAGPDSEMAYKVRFAAEAVKLRSQNGEKKFFNGISLKKDKDISRIAPSSFSATNLDIIRDFYAAGEMVGVRVPFIIEPVNGEPKNTFIDVFLKNDKSSEHLKISQYVRNNIIISEETSGLLSPFSFAMVIADQEDISSYLRLAEEPSHTRWYLGRFKKEGAYKSDWQLRLVKGVIKQLSNVLLGIDESDKEIKHFAADIFWINEPAGMGDAKTSSTQKGKEKNPKGGGTENKNKQLISIDKDADGKGLRIKSVKDFDEIMQSENMELPLRWKLKAAYMMPFKKPLYSPFDFDFSDSSSMPIDVHGSVVVIEQDKNELLFEISGKDFEIAIRGFDGVRDIKLKCKLDMTELEKAA